ncbi:hypothetical protein EFP40_17715 [Lactiplantibacillus pentosus]|nr:hypothetical protein [Lactiplantibacillus pentosus]
MKNMLDGFLVVLILHWVKFHGRSKFLVAYLMWFRMLYMLLMISLVQQKKKNLNLVLMQLIGALIRQKLLRLLRSPSFLRLLTV